MRLREIPDDDNHEPLASRRGDSFCVLFALAFSVAVSATDNIVTLLCSSIVPLVLLSRCGPLAPTLKTLFRLNVIGFVTAVLLAVTYPDFADGARKGAVLIARLNIISVTVLRLIVAMGPGRLNAALSYLGVPEKFRIILLLTQRGIFILAERMDAALRSVRLRAPRMKLNMKLKVFAGVTTSSLVHGADRSERMAMAIACRGGIKGFDSQFIIHNQRAKDDEHR